MDVRGGARASHVSLKRNCFRWALADNAGVERAEGGVREERAVCGVMHARRSPALADRALTLPMSSPPPPPLAAPAAAAANAAAARGLSEIIQ
ncbi:hypothetical protein EVAR_23267_1 [Eumeta japonica]|uniref:Uncharacterized protein n=1 Tax=Eumeta variegata TaxID=151549 RepID=A0A4C1V552_EUMVA|nr:hypothetical protein EVAR_23267_1 [Eumeta japonica]